MKGLLCLATVLATTAAHAQPLPIPNTRNPDWELLKREEGFRPSWPDTLAGGSDRMPKVDPSRGRMVETMPNALQRSITSANGYQQYWDADRRLQYRWLARPEQLTPTNVVAVYQQATGALFTYRKRPKTIAPQGLHIIPIPPK